MKFTCNARELNTACNNVMRAVSTKMTVPTIEGIFNGMRQRYAEPHRL